MVYALCMKITPPLFEAFLKCPTKCWLRANSEPPSGNTYAESPRRRSHHSFQESPEDSVQRYLIASKLGSYFRPHRHEAKGEFAGVIQGAREPVIFDYFALILGKVRLGMIKSLRAEFRS
jgi:hypothetical protein